MITKEQFTNAVENSFMGFANWFNSKPELLAMLNGMNEKQRDEFRAMMIEIFATEIGKEILK